MMHGRGLGRQLVVGHSLRRRQPLRPLLPSPEEALPHGGAAAAAEAALAAAATVRPAEAHSVNT